MGLSEDQKAMLRLLAQRGEEGYEDIAALKGIGVEEARERVKEALAQVSEPEEAPAATAPPEPTPSQPPNASGPTPEPPPPPGSEEASAPKPDTKARAESPTAPSGAGRRGPRLGLPKDRGALVGLGAGALAILALAIVLIVSGGEGNSAPSATAEGSVARGIDATATNKTLTQAVLRASDGSEALGQAIFGRFRKRVLLQVAGEGLAPSRPGESYAVWLSHGGKAMVPVGEVKVKGSGVLAARFPVTSAVLLLIARGAFDQVDVTRTVDSRLNAAVAQARKAERESSYTGVPVMDGRITGPLVGAAGK